MSIITEIIDWVKEKPVFWQEAVGRIIQKNNLSEEDLIELTKICKSEKNLGKYSGDLINLDKLKESIKKSESSKKISLTQIVNTQNINALQNNSDLPFEENGLTAIYGGNGSGKSSYVSILKQVCSARGNVPTINQNLFLDPTKPQNQKAKIKYKLENKIDSVIWENGSCSSEILKAVNIFDAKCASSYIEDEGEIAFLPSGLLIIEQLASACKIIEKNLDQKIDMLDLKKFDYSFLITEESNVIQTFLKDLSPKSNINKLGKNSKFTTKDSKSIKAIEQKIAELKTLDPTKRIKENGKIINRFNLLKTRYEQISLKLSIKNIAKINKNLLKKLELQNTIKSLTKKDFSDLPLDKIGSYLWKDLWNSAKKFYQHSTGKEFPDIDKKSVCPLCLQALSSEIKTKFVDFEKFVKSDIQNQLDTINKNLSTSEHEIKSINLDFSEINPTIIELNDANKGFKAQHKKDVSKIDQYIISIIELFSNPEKVGKFKKETININSMQLVDKIIKKILVENKKLSKKSVNDDLAQQNKALSFLKSKKSLFENKKQIVNEIKRLQDIKAFSLCKESCSTRNISLLSNTLSEKYITKTLKDNFKNELTKLGFSNIKISTSTRGVEGKQYHSLELDSSYGRNIHLKEILSEGEHRCISLAIFLSELSVSDHKSAIIFDDPVSSLDHRWREKIAKRIVEEASKRQVIIFTHDITFLLNLKEFFDDTKIQGLTRKKYKTGVVLENPPWDTMKTKKRVGILKQNLQKLEKIEKTETEENYKEASKTFYGKLREAWERCIEEVVLNEVVQRFRRSIQSQRLEKVVDLSKDDYEIIEENMGKCSKNHTGHDSAGALISEIPSSGEIKNDLNTLEEFRKMIGSRKS